MLILPCDSLLDMHVEPGEGTVGLPPPLHFLSQLRFLKLRLDRIVEVINS